MRTPYLKANGHSWLYQRAVPLEFRDLVGKKIWTVGLGRIDRLKAVARVRELATQHDALIAQMKRVAAAVREQGGKKGLATIAARADHQAYVLERAADALLAPNLDPEPEDNPDDEAMAIGLGTQAARGAKKARQEAQDARQLVACLEAPEDRRGHSWDALFALWIKKREPKITRKHESTVKLLKRCLPGLDYRKVTPRDIGRFRDWLEVQKLGRWSQVKHLDHTKALFSAAKDRLEIESNPAAGIKVDGKKPKSKREAFRGPQLKHILETAERTRWGGDKHEAVMWVLRLLVWTGARVGEITQLRKDDVYAEGGVALLHIREGHTEQSVKTGDARKVPLHPDVAAFVDYAAAQTSDFIFPFKVHETNRRGDWMIRHFPRFRRDVCKIASPHLTLHSIRHHFHDAMDNAEIPDKPARAIVGHAARDVHQKYGQGPGLRRLAAMVARVDPLAE